MKYYNNLVDSTTTSVYTTPITHPFRSCNLKRGKVLTGLAALLAIVFVVLMVTLLPKNGTNSSNENKSSASIETSSTSNSASENDINAVPTLIPSVQPSLSPSSLPTSAPSDQPNGSPSRQPTSSPTFVPSVQPSFRPSQYPTIKPTSQPTFQPTYAPSNMPTTLSPSVSPTLVPPLIPDFRIKLHYEPHYFWQDEAIERRWCISCTTCPYLNFNETNCLCDYVQQCAIGNQIWIEDCDLGLGQTFTVRLPTPLSSNHNSTMLYHQIQIVQDNNVTTATESGPPLCLTRTETRYVTVEICENYTIGELTENKQLSREQVAQLWDPIAYDRYNTAFSISPAMPIPKDNGTVWCLTNQHHPKAEEVIALKPCHLAFESNTGYWDVYPLPA